MRKRGFVNLWTTELPLGEKQSSDIVPHFGNRTISSNWRLLALRTHIAAGLPFVGDAFVFKLKARATVLSFDSQAPFLCEKAGKKPGHVLQTETKAFKLEPRGIKAVGIWTGKFERFGRIG